MDQPVSNPIEPSLPVIPSRPRTGALIVRGDRLVEVRTPSGHPPAVIVRRGDVQ